MDNNALVAAVDDEIATLQQVKRLLTGVVRRGRKPGIATAFTFGNNVRKKRVMSAAAKAKIRAAQMKRWAAWHKTHPKK